MNIDISKYEEIYNTYYSKIEKAVTNIVRHPCVNLIENLTNVEDYLRKILNISSDEWNDSVKEAVDSNIQICLDNISQTKSSIETNWQKAETLYKELLELLKTLNTETMTLKTLLSEKPKKSHYMHEEGDGLGNIQITYPGYANALSIWNDECKSKNDECEEYFQSINDKLKELKNIDGETLSINSIGIIGIPFNINSEFAHFTEDSEYILGLSSVEYTRGPDGKLTVRYNQKYGPWITTIDGVSLEQSGCGIMSLATALTSTFSYKYGRDIIVTPLDVALSLSEYAKANGKSGLGTYFPDGMGGYEGLTEAVSEIYGVTILYDQSGAALSKNQVINATDSSSTVVYSLRNQRHIAAVTGSTDSDGLMIADTGKGRATYVYGTNQFDGGKRSMIVSADDFGISGNYLTKNGQTQFADIGSMKFIVIDGQKYEIVRQQVENTDLYEYIIDFDS